jgi:hypothetical protein
LAVILQNYKRKTCYALRLENIIFYLQNNACLYIKKVHFETGEKGVLKRTIYKELAFGVTFGVLVDVDAVSILMCMSM